MTRVVTAVEEMDGTRDVEFEDREGVSIVVGSSQCACASGRACICDLNKEYFHVGVADFMPIDAM